MCKGIRYNLTFKLKNDENEYYDNLDIEELMKTCLKKVKEEYDIRIKMSNHIIFNLQHKPNYNPFVKRILNITKAK